MYESDVSSNQIVNVISNKVDIIIKIGEDSGVVIVNMNVDKRIVVYFLEDVILSTGDDNVYTGKKSELLIVHKHYVNGDFSN